MKRVNSLPNITTCIQKPYVLKHKNNKYSIYQREESDDMKKIKLNDSLLNSMVTYKNESYNDNMVET